MISPRPLHHLPLAKPQAQQPVGDDEEDEVKPQAEQPVGDAFDEEEEVKPQAQQPVGDDEEDEVKPQAQQQWEMISPRLFIKCISHWLSHRLSSQWEMMKRKR